MDSCESRASGSHGDGRGLAAGIGSGAVQRKLEDGGQVVGALSAVGGCRPGRSQLASAPQSAPDQFLLSGKGTCFSSRAHARLRDRAAHGPQSCFGQPHPAPGPAEPVARPEPAAALCVPRDTSQSPVFAGERKCRKGTTLSFQGRKRPGWGNRLRSERVGSPGTIESRKADTGQPPAATQVFSESDTTQRSRAQLISRSDLASRLNAE